MSEDGRLTPERLANLRWRANCLVRRHDGNTVDPAKDHPKTDGTSCNICDQRALHRHITAQQAEIEALRRMVTNLRQALIEHHAVAHCLSPSHLTALSASGGVHK